MSDTEKTTKAPAFKLPDIRGWAAIGAMALTFMIFGMIYGKPALLDNASFMQLVTLVLTGTVLAVYFNLFGGTKSGADASKSLADKMPPAAPPARPVVVEAPAQVRVDPAPADPDAPVKP